MFACSIVGCHYGNMRCHGRWHAGPGRPNQANELVASWRPTRPGTLLSATTTGDYLLQRPVTMMSRTRTCFGFRLRVRSTASGTWSADKCSPGTRTPFDHTGVCARVLHMLTRLCHEIWRVHGLRFCPCLCLQHLRLHLRLCDHVLLLRSRVRAALPARRNAVF